jgi:prevent-host-death family protein
MARKEIDAMKTEIGAYDAKTRLPELLRQVQDGKRFTITNRGKAVADLVPTESRESADPAAAIDKFIAFMKANPVRARLDVKAMIEDGRA